MSKENFSFLKGWSQVKNGDLAECRDKLMAALNITTRAAWGKRLKGEVEPKISEARAVEAVFAEYLTSSNLRVVLSMTPPMPGARQTKA